MNNLRNTEELNRRRRDQAKSTPFWFVGSVILHTVAFGLLLWFTPLREALMPEKKPGAVSNMTGRRIQELAERIDEYRKIDMLDDVQIIAANLMEFEQILDAMASNYVEFAESSAEAAPDLLEKLLDELEAQQKTAVETMENVLPELAKTDAFQDSLAHSEEFQQAAANVSNRQKEALKNQIPPLDTLDKAISVAQMAGMTQTAGALQKLLDNQNRAHTQQQAANHTNDLARAAHYSNPWELRHLRDEDHQTNRLNAPVFRAAMTPAQQAANETQRAAAELIKTARQLAATEDPSPEFNNAEFTSTPPPDFSRLARMDSADLYQTAVNLERRVQETYRDIRATERAIVTRMSIQNARRLTDVARTERPEINRELLRANVRTAAALERHKEALAEAVRETASINTSVGTLLENARVIAGNHSGFSVDLAMDWNEEFEEYTEAVTATDIEDDFLDIADYMRDALEGGDGNMQRQPNAVHPMGETKGEDGTITPANARLRPNENTSMRGRFSNFLRNMRQSRSKTASTRPFQYVASRDIFATTPGQISGVRTIGAGGFPATWLGLTTWHIIGPFPNPGRANIDRKFPPETVVDLDAVYEGKNGPISWEFFQSPFPSIVTPLNTEPYGIWYGYTELRLDRAMDLWVAIGSDDKSKIWVNDFLVWESAPEHKGWRTNEGYRRIHFRKGVNRILFRCENGWYNMGWSFLINLNPGG